MIVEVVNRNKKTLQKVPVKVKAWRHPNLLLIDEPIMVILRRFGSSVGPISKFCDTNLVPISNFL